MNPILKIKDLNNKVIDLLILDEVEHEIAFATLMSICLNIMADNEVSREDFLAYCGHLYDELVKPITKPVH
jgi:hypothetical protein